MCNYYLSGSGIEIELVCENGKVNIIGSTAIIAYNNGKTLTVKHDPRNDNKIDGKSYWGNKHNMQIEQYYSSIENGNKPDITGEEAFKTHKIMYAIYKSGKENIDVTFN